MGTSTLSIGVRATLWLIGLSLAAGEGIASPPPDAPHTGDAPAAEDVVIGRSTRRRPLLSARPGGVRLAAPISVAGRFETVDSVVVDPEGSRFAPDPALNMQLRVGALFDTDQRYSPVFLHLEYEHDLVTGVVGGGRSDLDAIDAPKTEGSTQQLRKGFARLAIGPLLTVGGGYMLSDWGMGLLANGGDRGWTPGSAYFGDPRGGDRVLRGVAATGPWTRGKLLLALGYDVVEGDDVLLEGDEGRQLYGVLVLGHKQPRRIGTYLVHRVQETADGKETQVWVFDVHGLWTQKARWGTWTAESEAALISGTTELAPSLDVEIHDVLQLGVAARTGLDLHSWGAVIDGLFASGDRNLDDGELNGFKADRNFEMGQILFQHVLAAGTARAPIRAADPELIGLPSEDLDRIPTRGAAGNTVAFFPRVWVRPEAGLELYGGPLIALGQVALADPRNSRLAGGAPRSHLDDDPDTYLGTEINVGVRYSGLFGGTRAVVGVEAATLIPGAALAGLPSTVNGGRFTLRYEL